MKKILMFSVLVVLSFILLSQDVYAVSCETFDGSNISGQNYSVWASPVKSYLSLTDDGRLMRVQYLGADGRVLIEYYDSSYNIVSRKYIEKELPVFGGFYNGGDAFYILTGQKNPDEKENTEVFRITKYDKSWNRLSSAGLFGANTTVPFDAGSARFSKSGKYLIIRTCHEMYKNPEDGLNHQANVTIQLDTEKMIITDSFTDVMNTNYGYVSHSFNQFVKVDGDNMVALDHGDAFPRSIVLIKYKTKVSSGKFTPSYYNTCRAVDMFPIAGQLGDNYTNCSVGGFEISDSTYIAAISSVEQGSSSRVRNIYISVLGKAEDEPDIIKLTSYTSDRNVPSTPHLVKLSDNSYLVLWEKDSEVCCARIDKYGSIKGSVVAFPGALSDCVPLVCGGKLIWYVWNENEVTFYEGDLNDLSKTKAVTRNSSHSYKVVSSSGDKVNLLCDKCSAAKTGRIPSDFSLWWETDNEGYFSSVPESTYHPGEEIRLWVRYTSADYNDYEVVSSDEDIIKISYDSYGGAAVHTVGEGTATVTVKSAYNPEIKSSYSITSSHSWQEKITPATCTQNGKAVKNCSACGESKTEIISALGHDMSDYKVTKQPTCTAQGKKVAACSRCSEEVSEAIAKLAHDENVAVKAVAATCTKSGKTEGRKCSMCGKVTVEQETIPALGHDMGDYKVTKEPTCTAQGKRVATCSRCSEEVSEAIEKLSHDENVTVKAVAATCTKSGKTEGKKCSMCGKVIVEQETIPALGHDMGDYKVTEEPTCTAQGEETAKCSRCDKEETKSIPKLGHGYNDYEVTKEPTCTAMGEKTAFCSRCNQTVKEDVARLPHEETVIAAVEPTCTKNGKTQGKKCGNCGRVLEEQQTVEKLGHHMKESVVTKATAENHGEILKQCSRCEESETQRVYMIKTVKAAKDRYAYNGKTPKVSVKVIDSQKNVLKEGEDYTVSAGDAKKVGSHTAKIVFKGKYEGSAKVSFDIVPGRTAKIKASESTSYIKLTWQKVSGATGYRVYQYDSKTKSYKLLTSIKGKNTYTVKKLKSGTAYKFAVKAYTKLSDGSVYWGTSVKAEFGTKPAAVSLTAKAGTRSAALTWSKASGASGYQIYYATSKNGDYKKLKSTKELSYKKTGLTKGRTYYFKVRAYKKVSGKTLYGAFSDIKSVKVK